MTNWCLKAREMRTMFSLMIFLKVSLSTFIASTEPTSCLSLHSFFNLSIVSLSRGSFFLIPVESKAVRNLLILIKSESGSWKIWNRTSSIDLFMLLDQKRSAIRFNYFHYYQTRNSLSMSSICVSFIPSNTLCQSFSLCQEFPVRTMWRSIRGWNRIGRCTPRMILERASNWKRICVTWPFALMFDWPGLYSLSCDSWERILVTRWCV